MNRLLLSTAALALTASLAGANSKSWTTVKGMLPDNVNVVVGANVASLRATSIYQTIIPTLIAKQPEAQNAFDLAKSTCGIDMHAVVTDMMVAMGDDERGVIVATLDKTVDQKRIVECLNKGIAAAAAKTAAAAIAAEKAPPATGGLKAGTKKPATNAPPPTAPAPIAKAPPPAPPQVTAKTTGKITEYTFGSEGKHLYAAWLAADVVAVGTDPDDKALLEKMLAGKGTKGAMASFLAKANSKSSIWLATTKSQPIQTGGTMKGAYGTIDTTKGNVAMDMSIVMASPKEAKGFVDQVLSMLDSMKSSIPPQFQKLVDTLKLTASADAANMKLTASEKDVLSIITLAMSNL